MQVIAALIAGLVFGAGLTVAQMANPRKILDFLDIGGIAAGTWDPTMLMVFAGALPTMFLAYQLQRRAVRPMFAAAFPSAVRQIIDTPLIAGSAIFGVGWGLAGVCPGPAVTAVALAGPNLAGVLLFIGAMVAGIMLSGLVKRSALATSSVAAATRT
jgi:uncharacterized protein